MTPIRFHSPTLQSWISIGAGKDRGLFALPEVEDEVLAGCEHGDVGRPYVIGALWNPRQTAHRDNERGDNNTWA